ncbi:MAG: Fic family protein [Rikenellaceae bacterium]
MEKPPKVGNKEYFKVINTHSSIVNVIEKFNDEYIYWSDIKYKKLPDGVRSSEELWTHIKFSRRLTSIPLWSKYGISTAITNYMQKVCHEFDMNFGGSWGTNSLGIESSKDQYLVSSLMEEAISSSKMEGAVTTRKVAKEMLRKKESPKDNSQQMIFNNYQTIKFVVENKDKPFSEELLLKIHSIMTENTLASPGDAGRFRGDDDVVVENGITHEVVHTPPSYEGIPEFIKDLEQFFNAKDNSPFIHPIIKGIVVHFMIGYIHPFVDGNGRTARALFYWYMLKNGYWLTEFLSISRIITKTKKSYEKAYLYSEHDENDIGYFITYNLNVLSKAFEELKEYIKRKANERQAASLFLKIGGVNERQAEIIKIFVDSPLEVLTAKEVESKFMVSNVTAKKDLIGLVERGVLNEIHLNKVKRGYVRSEEFGSIVGLD